MRAARVRSVARRLLDQCPRSAIMPELLALRPSVLPLPPLVDSLDDEEVLAGADVPESACFARERVERRRRAEPVLEPLLFQLQRVHRGTLLRLLAARVDVRLQRAVVK